MKGRGSLPPLYSRFFARKSAKKIFCYCFRLLPDIDSMPSSKKIKALKNVSKSYSHSWLSLNEFWFHSSSFISGHLARWSRNYFTVYAVTARKNHRLCWTWTHLWRKTFHRRYFLWLCCLLCVSEIGIAGCGHLLRFFSSWICLVWSTFWVFFPV